MCLCVSGWLCTWAWIYSFVCVCSCAPVCVRASWCSSAYAQALQRWTKGLSWLYWLLRLADYCSEVWPAAVHQRKKKTKKQTCDRQESACCIPGSNMFNCSQHCAVFPPPQPTAEGPGEDGRAGAWPFASIASLIHTINCKRYQFNQLPEYSTNWTSFGN